jgi:hypothetical protein
MVVNSILILSHTYRLRANQILDGILKITHAFNTLFGVRFMNEVFPFKMQQKPMICDKMEAHCF